ncbi:MAG: methionyl-tRNA formyltransferase [Steroidobacteraceae bacterium]
MRLAFAGTPAFAVPALDALVRSRHRVAAVFTQPDRRAGRGLALGRSPVKQRALEHGLAVHQPEGFGTPEAAAALRDLAVDAFVVVAYGAILPPDVLAIPSLGCFNIHASILPRWRGAAPIQRALLAGDASTGITVMRMNAGLDTGPILAVREIAIGECDTGGRLHDRLAALGGELIVAAMNAVAQGEGAVAAQPLTGVTYAQKISKAEAQIDWHGAATRIARQVRAFNPWPVAETALNGLQVRVWEAEARDHAPGAEPGCILEASGEGVDVACGSGALRILRLQLAGRKPLPAAEFIKAQRLAGMRFAAP